MTSSGLHHTQILRGPVLAAPVIFRETDTRRLDPDEFFSNRRLQLVEALRVGGHGSFVRRFVDVEDHVPCPESLDLAVLQARPAWMDDRGKVGVDTRRRDVQRQPLVRREETKAYLCVYTAVACMMRLVLHVRRSDGCFVVYKIRKGKRLLVPVLRSKSGLPSRVSLRIARP